MEEILKAELEAMVETNTLFSDKIMEQEKEIRSLKAEIEELKELLAENDIAFGDMIYGSDRGNEMKYDRE